MPRPSFSNSRDQSLGGPSEAANSKWHLGALGILRHLRRIAIALTLPLDTIVMMVMMMAMVMMRVLMVIYIL